MSLPRTRTYLDIPYVSHALYARRISLTGLRCANTRTTTTQRSASRARCAEKPSSSGQSYSAIK
ncbi:hypothetical protein DPMN_184401 [Dreissena polymorpha]|uniref:Uncharacterized protein n=1 Tax=Dreissena polymorpha TaxID=45954 RepID=A0A9D4DIQ0_DREPO|nr:hypothetical protein DPMN_184401 [Dreissena polymorpha]